MQLTKFRFPKLYSLYGRIFAIFWFTMFLVLMAVLSLPHLDPRKVRDIPSEHLDKLYSIRDKIERDYADRSDLKSLIREIDREHRKHNHKSTRLYFADNDGNVLMQDKRRNISSRAAQNFSTSVDLNASPKQRLYGKFMIAGPAPIELAGEELYMFVGFKWNQPPPLMLRLFDHPLQLLLAVMAVSTPLLLWLAWALSQPARRLESAAKRVAKGEFVTDPNLEKGTTEFRQAGESFNQMVEAVNQMVSGQQRLLSDISHELRSPLTRLRMATSLATRKQGESPELTRIDTEAQRLEQMIGELLELSRVQVNSHHERETQPLSSLWESILSDAQFEAEQMDKSLHYNEIPERKVSGNPQLLMSAVDNIVRNAIHYGTDEIKVTMSADEHQVTVVVDDNGEGVPDSELEAIFRPFYRVSTARDRHSGGTGLGLAITESAVRQHSGSITAERSPLGGLRVSLSFPLHLP